MSAIHDAVDPTRNFVTKMAFGVYNDRAAQHHVPTFVTAAGGMLVRIEERGHLRLEDGFCVATLVELVGHLNMLWMAIYYHDAMEASALTDRMVGVGLCYDLTVDQINEWQMKVRDCAGHPKHASGALLAYFDRIVEPIVRHSGMGTDVNGRLASWMLLVNDIDDAYRRLLRNPDWIRNLDVALDRVASSIQR